jgi:hypothetical protein
MCGINAFGIAEIAKGLFGCAEQSSSRNVFQFPGGWLSRSLRSFEPAAIALEAEIRSCNVITSGGSDGRAEATACASASSRSSLGSDEARVRSATPGRRGH